jgi:hypothetical protein
VRTASGGEFRVFLGGHLNAPPRIVPFAGSPSATPKAMKVITIDNTQFAWVALLDGSRSTIALFNLATGARMPAFDVDLNALEPLAITAGAPEAGDSDTFVGTTTAFLHVLVKSN